MTGCKGDCASLSVRHVGHGGRRYVDGRGYCVRCGVYIRPIERGEARICPCCHNRMRTIPRSSKFRRRFIAEREAKAA